MTGPADGPAEGRQSRGFIWRRLCTVENGVIPDLEGGAMNRLVVHHIYANGAACDFSGYRNHGLPFDATDTPAPDAPGFTYASEDSRVSVPPSNSLQDLLPVRAVVSFNLNPEGGLARSCYLIEGRPSFGLAVEPDGSLQGMILDAAGNWTGAQSPPRVVSTGTWHAARLSFTGGTPS
jgi:hypothetical protein